MLGIAFLIAVVALVLAVAFWFQWQSATSVVKALRAEADSARKDAEAARADARKAADEVKSRTAQLNETREKLNEVRRKAQEAKGGKTASRGAREAELEEDLAHARKLLEEAHAAEAAARKDVQAAKAAEAQARAELAGAQSKIRELSDRPAPIAASVPADYDAQRKQLEAARSELERQVEASDKNQREARRREQELRDEIKKYKGRAETNNRVYLVTKGELELTKERLAQAERKLWQAGIPFAPAPSKERPKATGPAAADRPREDQPPADESIAVHEGTPTPAEGTPPAVTPIRRD